MTRGVGVARRWDNAVRAEAGIERGVPPGYPSSATFVAAVARGDDTALRELFEHYAPLLRDQARAMGVRADDRRELVVSVLESFALYVIEAKRPPREVARYLVGALRNRARNLHRDDERRRRRYEAAYEDCTGTSERIVAECHSEYGVRTARALLVEEGPALRAAIEKLAERSAEALTNEERHLMVGLSHHVPLRDLAAHLGTTYAAVRVRVHRLRTRFRKLARQYVESLEAAERREMERFFRRAGINLGEGTSGDSGQ